MKQKSNLELVTCTMKLKTSTLSPSWIFWLTIVIGTPKLSSSQTTTTTNPITTTIESNEDSSDPTMEIWLAILLLFAGIAIMVCVCFLCCRFVCPMAQDENGNPMFGSHGSSSNSDPNAGIEMQYPNGGHRKKGHSHTNSRTNMIQANGDQIRSSEDYNQRPQTMYQKYLQNRRSDNRRLNASMKYQLKITDADGMTKNIDTNNGNPNNINNNSNLGNNTSNSNIINNNSSNGKRNISSKQSKNNKNKTNGNDDKYASTDSEIAEQYNQLQKSKYQRSKLKSKQRKERRKQKKNKLKMESNERDLNIENNDRQIKNINSNSTTTSQTMLNNNNNNNTQNNSNDNNNNNNTGNNDNNTAELDENNTNDIGNNDDTTNKIKSTHMTVETAKIAHKKQQREREKERGESKSEKKRKSKKGADGESVTDTEALYGDDELSLDVGAIILYENDNKTQGNDNVAINMDIDENNTGVTPNDDQ